MACDFAFRKKLYLGESMDAEKVDKIRKMLTKNLMFANVYVIIPAANPEDQLDILDARQFIQPHYKGRQVEVIGLAQNYSDALLLIERMVKECMEVRGDCNLREYLAC